MSGTFSPFGQHVHNNYDLMAQEELYVVDIDTIFDHYLQAFPEGTNPIFRVRTEYDCNCCKQFIRKLGCLVALRGDHRITVWDGWDTLAEPFNIVAKRMQELVVQAPIIGVFRTKESQYGTEYTYDKQMTQHRWSHFYGRVHQKHLNVMPDEAKGRLRSAYDVLERGLREIKLTALLEINDLMASNSLYRGEEKAGVVQQFLDLKTAYDAALDKTAFVWANVSSRAAFFRSDVIGTLAVDLSEGVDLEAAVGKFESKVAPENYKRSSALITPRMIDQAVDKLRELGLEDAIHRRFAHISDVSVNDVKFVDNAVRGKMKDGLKSLLMGDAKVTPVSLDHATPITADDFVSTILPSATSVQVLVENKLANNFVSITAPSRPSASRLFKWDNDFAWCYAGELADSSIKTRVKEQGGNVNALLRISLGWHNYDDLDLHVITPSGSRIYFGTKGQSIDGGTLDVDMNVSPESTTAVENIFFNQLMQGEYAIIVHNFTKRDNPVNANGFQVEIAYEGDTHVLSSPVNPTNQQAFQVSKLRVDNGIVTLVESNMLMGDSSKVIWGVKTKTLVDVETIMFSPNHWEHAGGVGNRHLFFMLKDCLNPEPVRGILNEYLRGDLEPYRKVFEVIGSKTKCPPTLEEQLSGLGFSSTKASSVKIVVDKKKAYEVMFGTTNTPSSLLSEQVTA